MAISYEDDSEYAHAKVSDSVIMVEGRPAYVVNVVRGVLTYQQLYPNIGQNLAIPLKDVDLTPVKLGYANLEQGEALYLTRLPARSWKQGLIERNIISSNLAGGRRFPVNSSAVCECMMGKYPSLSKVIEFLFNDEATSMAFSRDFALAKPKKPNGKLQLFYKGLLEVGELDPLKNTKTPVLLERHSYLRETLEEVTDAYRS